MKIVQAGPVGEHLVVRFIGHGEMFGTLAVYTGGGYPADAEAVTDCVEISWPATSGVEVRPGRPGRPTKGAPAPQLSDYGICQLRKGRAL